MLKGPARGSTGAAAAWRQQPSLEERGLSVEVVDEDFRVPPTGVVVSDRLGWTAAASCPRGRARRGRVEHAVEPAVDGGSDLIPAFGRHEQVRPALELDVVGLRR